MKLALGSLVVESGPAARMEVHVARGTPNTHGSALIVTSENNKPLPDGTEVSQIQLDFADSTGEALPTDALPITGPNLHSFDSRMATIYAQRDGQFYSIQVEIESAYSAGMESDLLISPGKSTFVSGQRFDVALLLPPGSHVAQVTASIDGQPLPMAFPGSCNLAPPNSQNRPTILCPDAQWHLPQVGGQHRVDWEVELIDGTTLFNPVEWTLIQ